jgi:hypothetical protein
VTLGGFGLSLRTEEIARFAQLYLQKGEWRGKQLVPAAWVAAATARQTSNGSSPTSDWEQGYGYQFWRCRHGLYRGDGAHGQFAIVMPEQDAVIAITSGTRDMQSVMNAVWKHILPALQAQALPPDAEAQARLAARLAALSMPAAAGPPASRLAKKASGRTFVFPENDQKIESATLLVERGGTALVVTKAGTPHRFALGSGTWKKGRNAFLDDREQPVAASGAWAAEDRYAAKACFYETPFCVSFGLQIAGDELRLDVENNVGRAPLKKPQLVGTSRSARPAQTAAGAARGGR